MKLKTVIKALAAALLAPYAGNALAQFASRAYLGTTELSSVSNPPICIAGGIGASPDVRITGGTTMLTFNNFGQATTATGRPGMNAGQRIWMYFTTDVTTAVLNAGYFTDAGLLGMRPFDVIGITACGTSNSTASLLRWTYITSISTAGAASVSSGMTSTA